MRHRHRRNAEELEALLDGRLSADEAGAGIRDLATLATSVTRERPDPVATLTPDRRLVMRDRLLDDIAALEAPAPAAVPWSAPGRSARTARAALASGVASVLIAGSGVTVAAQEALPGDLLYPLKRSTETARMNLAGDVTQVALLELRFAEARLAEVAAGARRSSAPSLVASLAEMDQRSVDGVQQLVLSAEHAQEPERLAEVATFLERQSTGLVAVFSQVPIEVRPHVEDSLATLRELRSGLLQPALEACDCLDVVPASTGDGEVATRVTSDPLPPREDETETEPDTPTPSSGDRDQPADEGDDPEPDLREDLLDPRRTSEADGVGSKLLEPLGETGTDLGDAVDDTLEQTTDGVGDLVEDTTEDLGDTLEDTTDGVGDLLGSTTDAVRRTLER